MTTLKNLKGTAIQFLDADPVVYAGSWSSGGSVNTARQYGAGIGSSTAGLIFGGSSPPVVANTEQYNGTAWTEVNDLNAAQNAQGSAGTLTSGMSALGAQSPGANVEDWNGSTWSANPHSLNSARQFPGGDGASNDSAIMVGGEPSPNGALTEIYNGSSWSESGDLNTARNQLAAAGTVTALIAMGGNTGADAETFNGSSWTAVTDMNSGRGGLSGSGTSTLALAFAGNPDVASTESWNGSAWTEVNDLSTGREFGASSNITGNTTAFLASGNTTTLVSNTEEFSFPPVTASVVQEGQMWFNSASSALKGYGTAAGIPAGTWATGGTLNAGHGYGTGFGLQTAAVCCFGGYPTHTTNTETYNGTAWTEVNEGNTARRNLASFGILTSGLAFGGGPPFGVALTESWNGTSWTEVNDLPTTVYDNRGLGASSASGLSIGGVDAATPGASKKANEWNGSSWTAITDMGTIRNAGTAANAGTVTAGLVFGGESPSLTVNTELWNGSSWTELNNMNTAKGGAGGNGISTSALAFGGNTPSSPPHQATINEFWNGTSWTELADLGTGLSSGIAPAGGAVAGLASGGQSAPATQNTVSQEWTADAAVSTVTTS